MPLTIPWNQQTSTNDLDIEHDHGNFRLCHPRHDNPNAFRVNPLSTFSRKATRHVLVAGWFWLV